MALSQRRIRCSQTEDSLRKQRQSTSVATAIPDWLPMPCGGGRRKARRNPRLSFPHHPALLVVWEFSGDIRSRQTQYD